MFSITFKKQAGRGGGEANFLQPVLTTATTKSSGYPLTMMLDNG